MNDGLGNGRPDVLFTHLFNGYSVLLRNNGFSYQYHAVAEHQEAKSEGAFSFDFHRIDVDFVEANRNLSVNAENRLYQNTYYLENGRKHVADVCNEVLYENVFDGVDIRFVSDEGRFKYDIICRDAEALKRVRLRFSGSSAPISLSESGTIILETRMGKVEERVPLSFFLVDGAHVPTTVKPVISDSGNEVRFSLEGEWPKSAQLVIDPLPYRLWSTYVGGEGMDEVRQVDVDDNGDIYVSGFTASIGNIATSGVHQGTLIGFQNCFLMKYSPTGQKLFGTYFGGQQADRCYGMLRDDDSGHIYLAGSTFSSGLATVGAHQTSLASGDDAILAKFDLQGQLVWSTYFGGNDHDFIADLALDSYGDVFLTGHTRSTGGVSTDLTVLPGVENPFVAKFSSGGIHLWGTYFGGTHDGGWGIGVDASDNIYVSGLTSSTSGISTVGSHQEVKGNGGDAFLVKYSHAGQLLWGTYFGGSGNDKSNTLVVSQDGSVVITGDTQSPDAIATSNGYQTSPGSTEDAFLARFSPDGDMLWGTYLGGNGVEYIHAICETEDGALLLAGQSESTDNVTSPNAFQQLPAGEYDALLMQCSAQGEFQWGTYLGGTASEFANDLAVDPTTGHVLMTGMTRSSSGISSSGVETPDYVGGLYDGFLVRFCVPPSPALLAWDGLIVCGDGELQFQLEENFPSILWNLGGNAQILEYSPQQLGETPIYADVVDETGCPGSSDTLIVSAYQAFDPELSVTAEPEGDVCIGSPISLEVSPTYDTQLWWNGQTGSQTQTIPSDTLPQWLSVTVFNADGCAAMDSIQVQAQLCTGLNEAANGKLSVYPNPSSGHIIISWPQASDGIITLTVYALDGGKVVTFDAREGSPIPLLLPEGAYLLEVESQNEMPRQHQLIVVR